MCRSVYGYIKDPQNGDAETWIHRKERWRGSSPLMTEKLTKESVHYRAGVPKRRCGNCEMYEARLCTLVVGDISPAAVCDKWEERK